MMWLFVSFAATALILAAIGTYGVVAYSTAQRTFEIGLRVALGATRRNIFGMVPGQSMRFVLAGLVPGVIASMASGSWPVMSWRGGLWGSILCRRCASSKQPLGARLSLAP